MYDGETAKTRDTSIRTIYQCLVLQYCDSFGMASSFKYICDLLKLPCICILGSEATNTMWNMVRLDGHWYHFDPSLNKAKKFFYFNIDDRLCFKDHTVHQDYAEIVPKCENMQYNFF